MKTFSFSLATLALLLIGLHLGASAQATRHAVIVEVANGIWSPTGPGAALGADQLRSTPASVGIVQHHQGDAYATPESNARCLNYYGVNNYPTAFFDGGNVVPGGGNISQSMYPAYQQAYNAAMAVPTPYELDASWTQNGASIDITVHVSQLGTDTATALRVQAVLTESYVPQTWFGLTECNFVNRAMYPDTGGQAVSLTNGGPMQTLTFNMPIDPSWVQSNMEMVVWLEDAHSKVIYNGVHVPLGVATYATDIEAIAIQNEIGATSCINSISPEIKIRNQGSATLTSIGFSYNVNGGAPMTYTWTGNVAFLNFAVITLPTIPFITAGTNTLTVSITNPADSNASNNTVTKSWGAAATYPAGTYVLTIQPDHYGSDITWEIKNTNGNVMAIGGPYNNTPLNNPLPTAITRYIAIPPHDCYQLTMHDAFGDGMCCTNGNGFYTLFDPLGYIVANGGSFTYEDANMWEATALVALPDESSEEVVAYPNPFQNLLHVKIPDSDGADISLLSMTGQLLHIAKAEAGDNEIDLSHLAAGMYLLRVASADGVAVQKIMKL